MTSADRAIVFEATDTTLLDVVQHKLEAEGLEPRRLGRTHAALMGGGNAAFMVLGAALGVLPISWRHPLWATGAFLLALAFLHAVP
jgi:hypothetical protein